MKKTLIALAALFMCLSCEQGTDKYEKLNKQAIAEYNIPIRPGYEGRNPYWNKFSNKFMYAPAFDFKEVEGAVAYKYIVKALPPTISIIAAITVSVTPITVYQPQGSCSITIPATTPTTLMELV